MTLEHPLQAKQDEVPAIIRGFGPFTESTEDTKEKLGSGRQSLRKGFEGALHLGFDFLGARGAKAPAASMDADHFLGTGAARANAV
jgi:hypothetical protein